MTKLYRCVEDLDLEGMVGAIHDNWFPKYDIQGMLEETIDSHIKVGSDGWTWTWQCPICKRSISVIDTGKQPKLLLRTTAMDHVMNYCDPDLCDLEEPNA
jgi:hypothetical protein